MKNEQYTVYVCFSDTAISEAFAALAQVGGSSVVTTSAIETAQQALNERARQTRLITEHLYARQLSAAELQNTLVVGEEQELRELNSPTLCRPLTEQKVERAFGELLG